MLEFVNQAIIIVKKYRTMRGIHFNKLINAELDVSNCWLLRCRCDATTPPVFQHVTSENIPMIRGHCTSTSCQYRKRGWQVCRECILSKPCNQRFRFYSKRQLQEHRKLHEELLCNPITNEESKHDEDDMDLEMNSEELWETMKQERKDNYFLDGVDEMKEYLQKDSKSYQQFYKHMELSESMKYVVSKMFTKSTGAAKFIDETDAEMHLLIGSISSQLGKRNNNKLARLFELIANKNQANVRMIEKERDSYQFRLEKILSSLELPGKFGITTKKNSVQKNIPSPLPTEPYMLRRYVEGSNCLLANIPIPTIHKGPGTSGYVLLSEALRCYLPYGLKLDSKNAIPKAQPKKVCSYWDSKAAREEFAKVPDLNKITQKVLISEWSDGMDPNGQSKKNRGSVHIMSMSLLDGENRNDPDNTFVLGVSREKDDHENVRKRIYDDFLEMENEGFTYMDGKKEVTLQPIFHVSMMDRPERSASTGVGNHMGANTLRWGYVGETGKCFVACEKCQKRRKLNPVPNSNSACNNKCSDWETTEVIYHAPDYPQEMLPENVRKEMYLENKKLSFGEMKAAAQTGAEKLFQKEWSKKKTEDFLKRSGWNGGAAKKIVDHANECSEPNVDGVLPSKFAFGKEIEKNIDAIMHLIFLGITKTVGNVGKKIFTSCGKYTQFHREGSDYLRELQKLKLEWCKAWNLGSTLKPFGPYVSENCLAYTRVLKCLYSTMTLIKNDTPERKLLLNKSMVLISSWIALVSRIMQKTVTEELVVETERHIKIFLSALHDVDTTLLGLNTGKSDDSDSDDEEEKIGKGNRPLIETTGNLSSLLNLPGIMREFGPLRNYWEGGYKGEGIIGVVKPAITQGTHMPWFATAALKKFYREKSVELLLKKEGGKDLGVHYTDTVGYRTYKSEDELKHHLQNKDSISAVVDNSTGKMYCSVGLKGLKKWVELVYNKEKCAKIWGTTHFEISTKEGLLDISGDLTNILWLPNRSTKRKLYYCVDENWLELTKQNCTGNIIFQLPQVYGVKY